MTIWVPRLSPESGPRYRAIAAAIGDAVRGGELAPGDRLPTQRALAEALSVTVGTVSRAYAEAERRGLVSARVGSGTYVRSGEPEPAAARFDIPPEQVAEGEVEFGLNLPVPGPREGMLARALRDIAADSATLAQALAYQPEAGLDRHRRVLGGWIGSFGTPLAPEQCLITLGAMHGLHVALQALTRPGDVVASAGLTYPGFIAVARQCHLRHFALALDDEGIVPESLAALCRQQPPRVLYVTPNQNNPTTACLPESRRRALLDLARRHDFVIVEDEVYPVAADERPVNLVDLDPERVIHVTAVSKVLAGGLRVGLLQSPPSLLGRLADALRAHCWMAPPLNAEIACRWIESGAADELARFQRAELSARHDLVGRLLGGADWRSRPYSFNVWLHLPEPWRASEFAAHCAGEGVMLRTGEPFAVGRFEVPPAVRLSISAPPRREDVHRGLGVIARLLAAPPVARVATL